MSAIKQDGPYDSRTLTKIFTGSSLLLGLSVVWMVLDDHTRPWKLYQEQFREIEVARATADVHEAERAIKAEDRAALEKEIAAAEEDLSKQKDKRSNLELDLKHALSEKEKADLAFSMAKAEIDSDIYFLEHAKASNEPAHVAEYSEKYERDMKTLTDRTKDKEDANLKIASIKQQIAALEERLRTASKKKEELEAGVVRTQKKLETIGHSGRAGFLNDYFRNKPVVDFLDRTIRERQIVLPGLKDDLYFAQVRKVDRCITCHLAIDRKGFEGAVVHVEGKGLIAAAKAEPSANGYTVQLPNGHVDQVTSEQVKENPLKVEMPFKSHPNLDLYVGSTSPHPADKFGCTVCHLGEGESISFTTAVHAPNDEAQRKEWHEKHHWEEREHWVWPQLPTRYVEASCLLCHANNRPVPGADKLNFGRETFERLSCVGCHKMKGYEDEAKRGPDLRRLTSKLTKDWVAYWIEEPKRFRPKTNMPQFWRLDVPTKQEKDEAKQPSHDNPSKRLYDYDVRESLEIRGVTEFLFDRSAAYVTEAKARGETFDLPAEFKKGDAQRGKVLFTARGCVGCHRIEPLDKERETPRSFAPDEFGPNLYNTGHKTSPQWIQAWVSNPKHYWSETRMPNLRLPEDEARDLATYLTDGIEKDGKNEVKDANLPGFAPLKAVDALTDDEKRQLEMACRDFLEKDYSTPDITRIFEGKADAGLPNLKDSASRLLYLGEQSLGRYGCFGCHYVKGMETRPGIGRELTDIGDKNLAQVDWGFRSVTRFMEVDEKAANHKNAIRENKHEWLDLKVAEPRFPDEGKVKAPLDRSRMPQFSTTKFEREALVTYLLGNTSARRVSEEYRYRPATRRLNVIEGEYAISRNNCKACHLFGVDQIALTTKDGVVKMPLLDRQGKPITSPISDAPVTTKAWLDGLFHFNNLDLYGASEGAAVIHLYADAPNVEAFQGKKVADAVPVSSDHDWKSVDEVRSPIVGAEADLLKVLNAMPEDTWASAEAKQKQLAAIKQGLAWRNRGGTVLEKEMQVRAAEKLGFDPMDLSGKDKFDKESLPIAQYEDAKTFGPPHLIGEGRKVQPLWLQSFLKNPIEIRPALRPLGGWADRSAPARFENVGGPKMPTYGFRDSETQTFSRYFASVDEEQRLFKARPLLDAIQNHVKEKADGYRTRLDIQKKVYDAMDSLAVREYFNVTIVDGVFNFAPRGDVSLSRALDEKTEGYVDAREAAADDSNLKLGGPGWYAAAYRLFVHPDVDCRKCHVSHGAPPGGTVDAWAPDLARVRERLRPEYLRDWVEDPKTVIPGTKMPTLFVPGKHQQILPGSPKVQVAAITDWLMAGAPAVLAATPKSPKAGTDVRLSSDLVNLDAVKKVEIRDAKSGEVTTVDVKDEMRERSAERTTAIRIPVAAGAKGKTYVVTLKDERFTASVDLTVTE